MNYGNIPCADTNADIGACKSHMTMADAIQNAYAMSGDAVAMCRRLKGFLINVHDGPCEKMAEPNCFQDVLYSTGYNLNEVCELLSDISSMLGVI